MSWAQRPAQARLLRLQYHSQTALRSSDNIVLSENNISVLQIGQNENSSDKDFVVDDKLLQELFLSFRG